MHPRNPRSRWLAASLYITAILGALVAPHSHHHHAGGSCCSTTDAATSCPAKSEHTHSHACGHSHSHSHETPANDSGDSQEPTSPTDHNCPVCRFLAQSVDLADPPRIIESTALALAVEDATAAVPFLRDEFRLPARGPPSV